MRLKVSYMKFYEKAPLHQVPSQNPGQPGKAWPGRAFRVLGRAYQESAAW